MTRSCSTVTLLLFLFTINSFGQGGFIIGELTDSISKNLVPYTQVYNESSKTYTMSDSLGKFKLKGRIGDTLVLFSMSYYGKIWIVESLNQNNIALKPRYYEIEPLVISVPRDYKQFRKDFLAYEPERGPVIDGFPRYIPKRIPLLLDTNYLKNVVDGKNGIGISITKLYYLYSKEEKSKRKVLYLQQEEREQVIINQKFSPQIIQKLTKLEGEELTDFILFCHFSHSYLYESSEYEVVEAIAKKLEEFRQQQDKKNKSPN